MVSSKTVLITGASGFTGRYILSRLAMKGFEIATVGRCYSSDVDYITDYSNVGDFVGILRDVSPDYLIHMSGSALGSSALEYDLFRANVQNVQVILEACCLSKIDFLRILIPSTGAVYKESQNPLREDSQLEALSAYEISKMLMEELVFARYKQILPVILTRPFNYTGVGQSVDYLIPKLVFAFANKKKSVEVGDLNVYRDISDVRDIAKAYEALLTSNAEFDCYNLCSGVATQLCSVVETLEHIAGYSLDIQLNSAYLRSSEAKFRLGDSSRLRGLGWAPHYGVRDTLEWMYEAAVEN